MNIDLEQELKRIQYHQTRAREYDLPATLTLEEWIAILEQWNGLCVYCQKAPFEVLEHITPLGAEVGGTIASNCVPACKKCNRRKFNYVLDRDTMSLSPKERIEAIRLIWQLEGEPSMSQGKTKTGNKESKTLRLSEEDIQAILRIRQALAIASDNQAIVYAIHAVDKHLRKEEGKGKRPAGRGNSSPG